MKPTSNLRIALFSVMLCLSAHSQNWNSTTAPSGGWYSMAGSQRGSNLVAAVLSYDPVGYSNPGQIYASTNGGQTWQLTSAPENYWISVAASTNGMKLVAAAELAADFTTPGEIFISTNGGLNWSASGAPQKYWLSVASSSDGKILIGAAYSDGIYVSTNYGTNWIQSDAPNNNWQGLAMSSSGLKMYAASPDGIYISTNTGSTWNLSDTSPPLCFSVACSGDGNRVFTGLEGGNTNYNLGVFTSTNGGSTWSQTSAPIDDTQNYQCLSMSTYGDILLAGAISNEQKHGRVYLSIDGGATWISQTAPTNSWGCVFCSADGTLLTAGEFGGSIFYASNPVNNPKLAIKASAPHSIESWPIFPAGFQLQVASTLTPPVIWTNASGSPVQSGTNYYSTNNLNSPGRFFRLVRP